jgi:large subunit ribosomal protein L23
MSSEERLLKILLAPIISEKSTRIGVDRQYVFKVIADATKIEIKQAVELLFKVKVTAVRICHTKSKTKKFGKISGRRKGWKKAYITLKEEQTIDFGALG